LLKRKVWCLQRCLQTRGLYTGSVRAGIERVRDQRVMRGY
jgi:hypothetical protein